MVLASLPATLERNYMKTFGLICILFLNSCFAFCEINTNGYVSNLFVNFPEKSIDEVAIGRKLIYKNLQVDNTQVAKDIYEYMFINLDTSTYVMFNGIESINLALLFREFDIIRSTDLLDKYLRREYRFFREIMKRAKIYNGVDLYSIGMRNKDIILSETRNILNEEEFEFVKLFYSELMDRKKGKGCKAFLKKYPKTKYKHIIKKHFSYSPIKIAIWDSLILKRK